MIDPAQPDLFGSAPGLPEGFHYTADAISPEQEQQLVREIKRLPLRAFEFQGYVGKRRVISFGWRYDFNDRALQRVDDVPAFLLPLRDRAAALVRLHPADLQHVLITEYEPGAAIGWHRDKAAFAEVVGISLLAPCRFRFHRPLPGGAWERAAVVAAPRSAYVLTGPSRTEWEHSIPPVGQLRYSITFRRVLNST